MAGELRYRLAFSSSRPDGWDALHDAPVDDPGSLPGLAGLASVLEGLGFAVEGNDLVVRRRTEARRGRPDAVAYGLAGSVFLARGDTGLRLAPVQPDFRRDLIEAVLTAEPLGDEATRRALLALSGDLHAVLRATPFVLAGAVAYVDPLDMGRGQVGEARAQADRVLCELSDVPFDVPGISVPCGTRRGRGGRRGHAVAWRRYEGRPAPEPGTSAPGP